MATHQSKRKRRSGRIRRAISTPNQTKHTTDPQPVELSNPIGKLQEPWSEESIMQLQRTIGNNQTIRLVKAKAPQQTHVIQRADTGMRRAISIKSYAADAFKLMTDKPDMAPRAFVTAVHGLANKELVATGTPVPTLVESNDGGGAFDHTTWNLEVDINDVFGVAATIGVANQAKVDDLINTIYHESRHAEQAFRIARMRAGKILPRNATDNAKTAAAQQIVTDTSIPANIARAAAHNPLYASWGSMFGGERDQMMEEAEAWDKSFFGVDKDYSDLMQGGFDDVIHPLMDENANFLAIRNNVLNLNTFNKPTRKQIRQDYRDHVTEFRRLLGEVDTLMTGDAQTELDRLNAIDQANRTPNDLLMLNHLQTIFGHYQIIQNNLVTFNNNKKVAQRPQRFNALQAINNAVNDINSEAYQAYKDLPEESDAFATGDEAQQKVGDQRAKVGNP